MNTIQVTDKFKIYCTNEIEKWRAETFWTKEPETIEWIKSFKQKGLFLDVGANIGIYSLYCASIFPNKKIIAIEPMLNNFMRLCQNIELNNFKNVLPLHIALIDNQGDFDSHKFISLNVKNIEIGSSGSQTSKKLKPKNIVPSFSFLQFCTELGIPQNVKIDVDGNEWYIIRSFINGYILYNFSDIIKSWLIEINNNKKKIFKLFHDSDYTENNRFNKLENNSRVRRAKEGVTCENVIFTRK